MSVQTVKNLFIIEPYIKNGSGIVFMQLASGFSVGFTRKAFMILTGQLVGEETPCPTPGNRKT